ncbi:MAG TPA: rod shape-determining protein RodA, partial [Gammaproteobacteria bacterium]|nr:rod shape-determining protein RodA [Gammaproteobacteria bacterium]
MNVPLTAGRKTRRGLFADGLHLDIPLLVGLALLSALGVVVLYSAGGQDMAIVERQLLRLGFGFTVMLACAQIPPSTLTRWTPWLYILGTGFLVAVLVAGETGKGAQRWLDLGLLRFQPSEIMKVAVPLMVAAFLAEKPLPPSRKALGAALLMIAIPALLVARQPDLGTALLVASAGVFVILLAGVSWRLVALVIAFLAATAPLLWYVMRDYQKQRVLTFLNPENDPLGAGYHIIQSK